MSSSAAMDAALRRADLVTFSGSRNERGVRGQTEISGRPWLGIGDRRRDVAVIQPSTAVSRSEFAPPQYPA